MTGTRLHVVLARAGLGSRRACEALVESGVVSVNGTVVTRLGTRVEPGDDVRIRGRRVTPPQELRYIVLNKPRGFVTTVRDEKGRPTVMDLLPGVRERVVPVGRLDLQSEGLLLLTNDGELVDAVTHPRSGVPRTYRAKIRGVLDEADVLRLGRGVVLERRRTGPIAARTLRAAGNASWIEVVVREGRKHLVRDALAFLGHPVVKLKRVALGPLALGSLPSGRARDLRPEEVAGLRATVGLGSRSKPPPGRRRGTAGGEAARGRR